MKKLPFRKVKRYLTQYNADGHIIQALGLICGAVLVAALGLTVLILLTS